MLMAGLVLIGTVVRGVAEELWSIGTVDRKFSEFALNGKYEEFPANFGPVTSLKVESGSVDAAKVPFVLPGPHDSWAGQKACTLEVKFDCDGSTPELPCSVAIHGWGQRSAPPTLEVNLNGRSATVPTRPNRIGDNIFTARQKPGSDIFSVSFPASMLKPTGNVLQITNTDGAWLVLDAIVFSMRTGEIQGIRVTPARGIRHHPKTGEPSRMFLVDYQGECLTKPATLTGTMRTEMDASVSVTMTLDPERNFDGVEMLVPVSELPGSDSFPSGTFSATLNIDGQEFTVEAEFSAQRKWEMFLVHQTHLDIGYTHTQVDVLELQVQSLRDSLKYIEETRNYPPEAQFRFHPEGMWAVDEFLRRATDEEKAEFIRAAQEKRIHIDALYAQAMTAMYNDEELFELMGRAVRFCHENDIPLNSAMQTDVPGYTWGLVTALAQNGIHYMSMGPNSGHRVGQLYLQGDRPFYWLSRSGKERVFCWLLDTGYHQFHRRPLGHRISEDEVFGILGNIPAEQKDSDGMVVDGRAGMFRGNMYIVRYGIEGDNGRPNRVLCDVVKEWNEKFIYPKLIISTNSDSLMEYERRYSDSIPTLCGDYTPYWEDGSASTSEATAINREASEKIVQAQTLWAMTAPDAVPFAELDAVYVDLIMYDEHTWGAYNSIAMPESDFVKQQDAYKQEYARRGSREVNTLMDGVLHTRMAGVLDSGAVTVEVYNTTDRPHGGMVCVPWSETLVRPAEDVLWTMIAEGDWERTDASGSSRCQFTDAGVVFRPMDVPPFGSRIYTVSVFPSSDVPQAVKAEIHEVFDNATLWKLENRQIRLLVESETGAIVSIYKKHIGHEFVALGEDDNHGLNDYLYIIGRDASENRQREITDVRIEATSGDCFGEIVVTSKAPNCRELVRKYRLEADSDLVYIENMMDKELEYRPEGTFFGFPFNIPGGKWTVNTPFANVRVEDEQLVGANRNYYTVERYCTLLGDRYGIDWITPDANMVQFAPIRFTPPWGGDPHWRRHIEPDGTIYSWVCNNHWETNYKAGQDGKLTFRYILRPFERATDPKNASEHVARGVTQPLIARQVEAGASSIASRLVCDNTAVTVTSLKPTRDGSGRFMIRLYNSGATEEPVTLSGPTVGRFYRSNPLEERGEACAFPLTLAPYETLQLLAE